MLYAILLQLDLHPRVAGSTSQWLGVLISTASSICMLVYGMIPIDYAVVINSFTAMGTLYGMWLQEQLHLRTGKHQYSVLAMILGIILILVATSYLSIGSTYEKHQKGEAVFEFQEYC